MIGGAGRKGWGLQWAKLATVMALAGLFALGTAPGFVVTQTAIAQEKSGPLPPPVKKPKPKAKLDVLAPASNPQPPALPLPPERIEADVSARAIAVTAAFKGSEIIVFGTVDNSRQPSPESGYYDLVVTIEGGALPSIVRRKSNIGGIWINNDEAKFDAAPAFYALATTRPLEEIAEPDVLAKSNIGVSNLRIVPSSKSVTKLVGNDLRDFTTALTGLKARDGLYAREDVGVVFTGRSLFRSTIGLPANVPVGNLVARVFLFRDGVMLSKFTTRVSLERAGVERWIHEAAHKHAWLYGIFTVIAAMSCGLAAASIFGRSSH
jgi:uncharacterized protein (TIGR02186 family)